MEDSFEWELIETSKNNDLTLQRPRKLCRTSIIEHLKPVFPIFLTEDTTLKTQIYNLIPDNGITVEEIEKTVNKSYAVISNNLQKLMREEKIIALRFRDGKSRYYRTDNVTLNACMSQKLRNK